MNSKPLCIPAAVLGDVPSPSFVVDEALIERNLRVLDTVQRRTGAQVVLALKGFAMHALAPLVMRYLPGTTASGLHEARLGREVFGGVVHSYGPAYADHEIDELAALSDHLSFNSPTQWQRFRQRVQARPDAPACGLRVNPEHREVETAIYDPCAPMSRLGTTRAQLDAALADDATFFNGLSGLHVHTLCENNSDALERMYAALTQRFGDLYERMSWLNLGGGHHITRPGYDVDRLCRVIDTHRAATGHNVVLEPGEAVGLNAGVLVATVLDVLHNGMPLAVLDVSATCHMPDVLEMPYRPAVGLDDRAAGEAGSTPDTYRLGGGSCLAGDVIGDYAFHRPLRVGDRLVFGDMAHYSMVKTTTFNGVPLPSLVVQHGPDGGHTVVRRFGDADYRGRLS